MNDHNPTYDETRQAWRDIWAKADFERELQTLNYRRANQTFDIFLPYLDRATPVLEAGCGMGQVVYHLRQRGYQAIGVDYAPEAIKPTLARYPGLPLYVGDVHHLPFPSNCFGGYLSFGVVEHFEQGPQAALAEAYRVLCPGGTLVLSVPHPNVVEGFRNLANRIVPWRLERLGPRAAYYERTYPRDELFALTAAAGFHVQRIAPYSHSYTFYGLGGIFRSREYYGTSALAEAAGNVGRVLLPWATAYSVMIIASKPEHP